MLYIGLFLDWYYLVLLLAWKLQLFVDFVPSSDEVSQIGLFHQTKRPRVSVVEHLWYTVGTWKLEVLTPQLNFPGETHSTVFHLFHLNVK